VERGRGQGTDGQLGCKEEGICNPKKKKRKGAAQPGKEKSLARIDVGGLRSYLGGGGGAAFLERAREKEGKTKRFVLFLAEGRR